MLLNINIENCYSFKDMQELSMEASKVTKLPSHVTKIGRKRILLNAAIFGANASGKSNFIKAIDFSRKIILKGTNNVNFDKKYFRIDNESYNQPGRFSFQLLINKKIYDYSFSISYKTQTILNETFFVNGLQIFNRKTDANTVIEIPDNIKDKNLLNRLNIYIDDFKQNPTSKYKCFLSEIAEHVPSDLDYFVYFTNLYNWFSKIQVIYPNSTFSQLSSLTNFKTSHDCFEEILKCLDTGILGMENQNIEWDDLFKQLPPDLAEEIKKDISKTLLENNLESITLRLNNNIYCINKDQCNNIQAYVTRFNHGNKNDPFDFSNESDGTRRLFDLIPLLLTCKNDSLILIDELDRSLHPLLTQKFLQLLSKILQTKSSQIIMTTHDSSLFDLNIFRIDEICLMNRAENQSSIIKKLNKLPIRYDKKINRDFLLNFYGGVPTINNELINNLLKLLPEIQ